MKGGYGYYNQGGRPRGERLASAGRGALVVAAAAAAAACAEASTHGCPLPPAPSPGRGLHHGDGAVPAGRAADHGDRASAAGRPPHHGGWPPMCAGLLASSGRAAVQQGAANWDPSTGAPERGLAGCISRVTTCQAAARSRGCRTATPAGGQRVPHLERAVRGAHTERQARGAHPLPVRGGGGGRGPCNSYRTWAAVGCGSGLRACAAPCVWLLLRSRCCCSFQAEPRHAPPLRSPRPICHARSMNNRPLDIGRTSVNRYMAVRFPVRVLAVRGKVRAWGGGGGGEGGWSSGVRGLRSDPTCRKMGGPCMPCCPDTVHRTTRASTPALALCLLAHPPPHVASDAGAGAAAAV
jgi:hypothetical protein